MPFFFHERKTDKEKLICCRLSLFYYVRSAFLSLLLNDTRKGALCLCLKQVSREHAACMNGRRHSRRYVKHEAHSIEGRSREMSCYFPHFGFPFFSMLPIKFLLNQKNSRSFACSVSNTAVKGTGKRRMKKTGRKAITLVRKLPPVQSQKDAEERCGWGFIGREYKKKRGKIGGDGPQSGYRISYAESSVLGGFKKLRTQIFKV